MPRRKAEVIRENAYHIWEREGRPEGREVEHWLEAEANVGGTTAGAGGSKSAVASKPARRAPVKKGKGAATKKAASAKAEAKSKTKTKTTKKVVKRAPKKK
jgi:hypothetical protein